MVRWSSEPRRMPIAGGSWAASFSRLRIACFRVISNDDTHITEASQYIFSIKCFWKLVLKPDRRSLRGDRGSIRPTATSRLYGNKQLGCGILSGKLATFPLKIRKDASVRARARGGDAVQGRSWRKALSVVGSLIRKFPLGGQGYIVLRICISA